MTGPSAPDRPAGTRPVVVTRWQTEVRRVPFATRRVEDPALPPGTTRVRVPGEPGSRTLTYEVTTVDGRETGRRLIGDRVTRQPVTRVVAVGIRVPGDECRPDDNDCLSISVGCLPGRSVSPDDAARLVDDGIIVLDRARLPAGDRPSTEETPGDKKAPDDRKARGDRKADDDGRVTADRRAEPVCETILGWR